MRTKNICNAIVEDFITGWKNITVLELSYSEYLKYERLDENCPFNITGCLFNAMHKSNKHFGRISFKKFKFTKLAFLNNLKKRKEWLDYINSLRREGKLEKVKHSDEIARIEKALEVYNL